MIACFLKKVGFTQDEGFFNANMKRGQILQVQVNIQMALLMYLKSHEGKHLSWFL